MQTQQCKVLLLSKIKENLEESFEMVILAENQGNRLENEKKRKTREESRNQVVAEKFPMKTQVGTLVYSASEELDVGIAIIFI